MLDDDERSGVDVYRSMTPTVRLHAVSVSEVRMAIDRRDADTLEGCAACSTCIWCHGAHLVTPEKNVRYRSTIPPAPATELTFVVDVEGDPFPALPQADEDVE